MTVSIYTEKAANYRNKAKRIQQQLRWLSIGRLMVFLTFIFLIYQVTQNSHAIIVVAAILAFVLFLVSLRWYSKLQQQNLYYNALAQWNEKEMEFLQTHKSSYDTGAEYEDPQHPFSYDLDLFSAGGLFSYLNRCSTNFGKDSLAKTLTNPNVSDISARQKAIEELASKLDFRQQLYAHGSLHQSRKKDLKRLLDWADGESKFIHPVLYYVLMLLPLITVGCLVYYFISENENLLHWFYRLFTLNLIVAFSFTKKITSQLSVSSSVTKILNNYFNQLKLIEETNFQSPLLKQFQQNLQGRTQKASVLINQLAALFNYLETVVNLVVSILLNGIFLFHVHVLFRLGKWKQQHARHIKNWLEIIGEAEALSSLANLAHNNPSFCFPEILTTPTLQANALGHILVNPTKRVCNDVAFDQQQFAILTGSNMSGKSTFLRTLGTNLILAKAGSVVCASSFRFYPFSIFVSMRISDSLQDSESFFYAELKRLHAIIQSLKENKNTFIILDEILRGTNSNDKRNGTIGLIKKLATYHCYGIIATHDVVVAELIKDYPAFIMNKAFESAIIQDELKFDYKMKDGVCTTLSASYLMKKMEII